MHYGWYWVELLPTPQQQTAQRYLPNFLMTPCPPLETRNLVFVMFTWRLLHSMPAFYALLYALHSSVMSIRSSAQRSFHSAPVRNSRESTSSTKIKSSGLRTGPWCTPNFYTKLLPVPAIDPHMTLEYMPCMVRRAHYPTQRLLKADHRIFFGKRPKAFLRLTEAK